MNAHWTDLPGRSRAAVAAAAGGVVGPITFIAGWALLGAGAEGYDPSRHPISRLAALGAPTRPAMSAALVVLAMGMVLYGIALRPLAASALAVANGMATLAVAVLPLGGGDDTAHGVAAALGYATLAAIPVVVGRARPWPVVIGVLSGALLLASVTLARDGLFQRAGLTVAQLWVAVSALGLLRAPTWSSRPHRARGPVGRRR